MNVNSVNKYAKQGIPPMCVVWFSPDHFISTHKQNAESSSCPALCPLYVVSDIKAVVVDKQRKKIVKVCVCGEGEEGAVAPGKIYFVFTCTVGATTTSRKRGSATTSLAGVLFLVHAYFHEKGVFQNHTGRFLSFCGKTRSNSDSHAVRRNLARLSGRGNGSP